MAMATSDEAGPSRSRSITPLSTHRSASPGYSSSTTQIMGTSGEVLQDTGPAGNDTPTDVPPSDPNMGAGAEQQDETRRAMMASAVAGLQRFKQTFLSVMVLKAGIGLGQVAALITLLVLAAVLPSPLYSSQKQQEASAACPKPGLFQAWCIVQIVRLTTCWSVSVWIVVRQRQARRRREDIEAERAAAEEEEAVACQAAARELASRGSGPLSVSHPGPTNPSATLGSTASRGPGDPPIEMRELIPPSPKVQGLAPPPTDRTVVRRSLQQARDLAEGRPISRPPPADSIEDPAGGFAGWLDRNALRAGEQDTGMKLMRRISQSLGIISTILFILGNILLFYPPPTSHSCYAASPMLWWGVMVVCAIGWILFAQVFFVVVIVGLGGHVALESQWTTANPQAALRRLGLSPAPAPAVPERPPRPPPLLPIELQKLKTVCYVPLSTESSSTFPSFRLSHPPLALPADKALCAICQENFTPPEQCRMIMLKAEPLRLLGCGHVFHWLLQGSGNCPFCNRNVRETLHTVPTAQRFAG